MAKLPEAAPAGLSAADALAVLAQIDRALDALCATAPNAIAALGGRQALQRSCQMTCIGPVPRLDDEQWALMAAEYVGRNSRYGIEHSGKGEAGPKPWTDGNALPPSVQGRGFPGVPAL